MNRPTREIERLRDECLFLRKEGELGLVHDIAAVLLWIDQLEDGNAEGTEKATEDAEKQKVENRIRPPRTRPPRPPDPSPRIRDE
jgi:hypothetical protein